MLPMASVSSTTARSISDAPRFGASGASVSAAASGHARYMGNITPDRWSGDSGRPTITMPLAHFLPVLGDGSPISEHRQGRTRPEARAFSPPSAPPLAGEHLDIWGPRRKDRGDPS